MAALKALFRVSTLFSVAFLLTLCTIPPRPSLAQRTNIPYIVDRCEDDLAYMAPLERNGARVFEVPEKYNSGEDTRLLDRRELPLGQFELAIPRDGEAHLQVYNNSTSGFYLRAIAVKDEGRILQLMGYTYYHGSYENIDLSVDPSTEFKFILVEVRPAIDQYNDRQSQDDFIGLAAYDDRPKEHKNLGPRDRPLECDGKATSCYTVITACNGEFDVTAWVSSLGLEEHAAIRPRRTSEMAVAVVACVEPGMVLNTKGPGGVTTTIRRDTTDGSGTVIASIVPEFPFTFPPLFANPIGNLLNPPPPSDDDDPNREDRRPNQGGNYVPKPDRSTDKLIQTAFPCLNFLPQNGDGEELVVTIIDSGVSTVRKAGQPAQSVWDDYRSQPNGTYRGTQGLGYDYFYGDNDPNEEVQHGTMVAGAIIGNYTGKQKLTVVHHKIFDGTGEGTYYGALEAIYDAADSGTDVLNLSWGITGETPPAGLDCAIQYALNAGVVVVASAGNDNTDIDTTPQWPAAFADNRRFEGLITVGSYELNDYQYTESTSRARWSNFGDKRTSIYGFQSAEVPTNFGRDLMQVFGTSISAPLVAAHLLSSGMRVRLPLPAGTSARPVIWKKSDFFNPSYPDSRNSSIADHPVHVLYPTCDTNQLKARKNNPRSKPNRKIRRN